MTNYLINIEIKITFVEFGVFSGGSLLCGEIFLVKKLK